jgi:hypothetical protein
VNGAIEAAKTHLISQALGLIGKGVLNQVLLYYGGYDAIWRYCGIVVDRWGSIGEVMQGTTGSAVSFIRQFHAAL